MNILVIIGVVLGAIITVVDRYFRTVPNKLAVIIYLIALTLIIIGMINTRTNM